VRCEKRRDKTDKFYRATGLARERSGIINKEENATEAFSREKMIALRLYISINRGTLFSLNYEMVKGGAVRKKPAGGQTKHFSTPRRQAVSVI